MLENLIYNFIWPYWKAYGAQSVSRQMIHIFMVICILQVAPAAQNCSTYDRLRTRRQWNTFYGPASRGRPGDGEAGHVQPTSAETAAACQLHM